METINEDEEEFEDDPEEDLKLVDSNYREVISKGLNKMLPTINTSEKIKKMLQHG